jgi:4-hydroxybenzoate polyprenyltransferase
LSTTAKELSNAAAFGKLVTLTIRPQQWYKNVLLMAGLMFSHSLLFSAAWQKALPAAILFCAISSCEYLINDVFDRDADGQHPIKKKRLIAALRVNPIVTLSASFLGLAVLLVISYLTLGIDFFVTVLTYATVMIAYSWKLKHIITLDVLIISFGFVIRAVAGCVVIGAAVSPWLIICTSLLALLLSSSKRRSDLIAYGDNKVSEYTVNILNQYVNISAAATLLAYLMYSFTDSHLAFLFTIPMVIYGIFRYVFLIYKYDFGSQPERIFKDKALASCLGLWVITLVVIIYALPRMGG